MTKQVLYGVVILAILLSAPVAAMPLDQEAKAPAAAPTDSATVVILEKPTTLHPAYSSDECKVSWKRMTNNRGYHFYLTLNTKESRYSTNWAEWRPNLPYAGQYRVEAYIPYHSLFQWPCPPPNNGTVGYDTSDAHYTVYYAGNHKLKEGNQRPLSNQWLNLGTYTFNAGTEGYVKLTDLNHESNWTRTISFSAIRFTYVSGASISGKVTDGINPVAGVTISDGVGHTATTDSEGNYAFNNLSAGTYTLTPQKDGPGCVFSPASRTVQVPPSADADFVTTAQCAGRQGTIGGRVTDKASNQIVRNAQVSMAGLTTYTDNDGLYSLTVPAGTNNLRVSKDGYRTCQASVTVQANQSLLRNVTLTSLGNIGYRLPFPEGKTYRCNQGNNGWYSHSGIARYAFDWSIPVEGKVVAARDGRVVAIKENSETYCNSNKCANAGNYVRIKHNDNTETLYLHLKKGSVSKAGVKVGQYVKSGQVIGRVGLSGWITGAHLHFQRQNLPRKWWGQSIPVKFDDVSSNGGVPQTGKSYTSGNHYYPLSLATLTADIEPPVGSVQFRLSGQVTYTLWLEAMDYDSNAITMRLGASADSLQIASWQPFTDTVPWTDQEAWVQFKDEAGNVSEVYSDTIEDINYGAIQAAFAVSSTVCAGAVVPLVNQTVPLCEQCDWHWDFGDGEESIEMEPGYPDAVYAEPGVYTITLRVTNFNQVSTVARRVTVIPSPSAEFTLFRTGNVITVTAQAADAVSWVWDFGDGSTATGRTATHTYTPAALNEALPVELTVESGNGCTSVGVQYLEISKVYLPLILKGK